jgi:hypothetical protein
LTHDSIISTSRPEVRNTTSIPVPSASLKKRQPSRGRIESRDSLDRTQDATTMPPSEVNDAVLSSSFAAGRVGAGRPFTAGESGLVAGSDDGGPVPGAAGVDDHPSVVDSGAEADGVAVADVDDDCVGVSVDEGVRVVEFDDDVDTTHSAAEARPTPRPALPTTTKVIAPTASTSADQPSTITRSGRRPIPTTFTLFLL